MGVGVVCFCLFLLLLVVRVACCWLLVLVVGGCCCCWCWCWWSQQGATTLPHKNTHTKRLPKDKGPTSFDSLRFRNLKPCLTPPKKGALILLSLGPRVILPRGLLLLSGAPWRSCATRVEFWHLLFKEFMLGFRDV